MDEDFDSLQEVEKFFKCPSCFEKISMILDLSIDQAQTYIEDCEVCCRPIQVSYQSVNGKVRGFSASAT
ncbi:MAG: CPXCG motif-containing cysteine-rich protein [Pseudobdellovibrionaceae bacterium]